MDKILEKTAPRGAAWFVVLTSYYQSDQVGGNVMGAPCSTYGGGIYIYTHTQSVPGGMCQTSGGCSLC